MKAVNNAMNCGDKSTIEQLQSTTNAMSYGYTTTTGEPQSTTATFNQQSFGTSTRARARKMPKKSPHFWKVTAIDRTGKPTLYGSYERFEVAVERLQEIEGELYLKVEIARYDVAVS